MSFKDLLKQPLPSQRSDIDPFEDDAFLESVLEDIFGEAGDPPEEESTNPAKPADDEPDENDAKDTSGSLKESAIKNEGFDIFDDDDDPESDVPASISDAEDDDDDDDFDFSDDMSDAELDALDDDIEDDNIGAVLPDEPEEQLSADEEQQADDMMGVAATALLVNNEMNAQEKAAFIESERDCQIAINEGLLLESDINELAESVGLVQEKNYNKKMIIRLDKDAKMKQLYALGINVSAASHNDPDWKKLRKVNRIRKVLRGKLRKKYHAEALKRMKIYFKRLRSSKSGPLANIGKKFGKK